MLQKKSGALFLCLSLSSLAFLALLFEEDSSSSCDGSFCETVRFKLLDRVQRMDLGGRQLTWQTTDLRSFYA